MEYAETFAREHGEPGTLSVRHLQRLVSGSRPDGRPLGSVRPATARLLERIFGLSVAELLATPQSTSAAQSLRAAISVVVSDSKVLLVCRRGEEPSGISWHFPAGLVKPDMSAHSVAVRETFTETGIHCVVARALGSRLHPTTKVVCEYVLCDYVTGMAKNLDVVENIDVLWAETPDLTRFIPAEHIYEPVLAALRGPGVYQGPLSPAAEMPA
ncbi:NUDIX hydrolase [Prauserella halophila]|uniref:NUDIX hydrolase n=1 Tax=Prauserella halophila TaxID=185641 RepID=UPI0020A2BDC5|nr:NUDIX hydrolase [Prauserella halophila]MCP2234916.1 ADP-ribose pyrophosphatase YjhB, NUDIX family [Prauserella halophila]